MKTLFLAALCVLFAGTAAQARWATPDDAEVVTESMDQELVVHKDGTHEATTETMTEVLREGGRSMSTVRLGYNSRAAEFEVLAAETLNEDQKFTVEKEFIEDKPMASRINGFDQTNLVVIAFPKVGIGSKVHLKIREKTKEVPIPNQYSARFDFGTNWFVKKSTVLIRSELPLFIEKNDPKGNLVIEQTQKDKIQETRITLKAPIYTRAIDEPSPTLGLANQTWVLVSSVKGYAEIANAIAEEYEKTLSAELPESYAKILSAARTKTNPIDQINAVTSALATEVRYMGDWRPIAGGHIPRPLETVAKTKFGDCKDFSAGTVAILRKLGMTANVAWVERAVQPTPIPKLGYQGAFNHAIVRASLGKKIFWIDPTNFSSFAQGVFEDIIDRQALVIKPEASYLDSIPAGSANDSVKTNSSRIALETSGDASIDAKVEFKGRMASGLTGVLMKQSKERIDHLIVTAMTDENRLKWKKIDDYDLTSRITRDFALRVRYGESNYSVRTTVGPAFYLDQKMVDQMIRLETQKRVSDLFLGHSMRVESTDYLDQVKFMGTKPPECHLDTPWMRVSRQVTQTDKGLKITDIRENKKSMITNTEIKSKGFRKFQQELQKCFDRIAVVYEPLKSESPRSISSE